jgi:hypothetical protein
VFRELIFVCHVKDRDESRKIHFRGVALFKDFVRANQAMVERRLRKRAKDMSLQCTKQ